MSSEISRKPWLYRGHPLQPVEWGLWKDLERPGVYFVCYRPSGRRGPVIRQWALLGPALSLQQLRDHLRTERSRITARKLGITSGIEVPAQELYARYRADLVRREVSVKHLADIDLAISQFVGLCPPGPAAGITVHHVQRYLETLADRSPRTQNKHRGILLTWLTWACKHELLELNPVVKTSPVPEHPRLVRFPMPRDLLQIVRASAPYDKALWAFLALTGLRCGSLTSLDLSCFTDTGIRVPHTKRGVEWQLRYDDGCPLWSPELSRIGRRIWRERVATYSYLQDHFGGACRSAGHQFTLHSLRHAFCSWLALMGEPIEDIAAWTHHASPQTTQRYYAHLRPRGRIRIDRNRRYVFTARSHLIARALGETEKPA